MFLLAAATYAVPQEYGLPSFPDPELSSVAGTSLEQEYGIPADTVFQTEAKDVPYGSETSAEICRDGEILHVDGTCTVPIITRNIFVYNAPKRPQQAKKPRPNIPLPQTYHNIIFIRLPEREESEPIIIPPPNQKSIVYVLNKNKGGNLGQQVIEVAGAPPTAPDVYFVNYEEGENPTLPIGVDLKTALSGATETGGYIIGGLENINNAELSIGLHDTLLSGPVSDDLGISKRGDANSSFAHSKVASRTSDFGPPPSVNIYSAP